MYLVITQLMVWAIRKIQDFLELQAKPLGIKVCAVWPHYTSQVCSACGQPGKRASLPSKSSWEKFYYKKYGEKRKWIVENGGKMFVCSNPNCVRKSRMINADINASLNLHKKLYGILSYPPKTKEFKQQLTLDIQNYLDTILKF